MAHDPTHQPIVIKQESGLRLKETRPQLSVVVPCMNEELVIAETARRLVAVFESAQQAFELIFVDDGSQDKTPAILRDLQERDSRIRVVRLSRNFGHQVAITAGLEHAAGDAVEHGELRAQAKKGTSKTRPDHCYREAVMKNRWLIAASAVGIHLCIGSVYAWSVFNLPLENAFGWAKSDIAITFSLAIFFLGMSAAVLGHFVERYGPSTSGMVAAAFWGTGLIVASLGVKLGILEIILLGYGVLGGIGLGVGYITPVSTLVKWFPDRRGLATGLAIMGFGFGAAIGAPVFNYIMSSVTASKLDITSAEYLAGISSYNSAKAILKDIHVNLLSTMTWTS